MSETQRATYAENFVVVVAGIVPGSPMPELTKQWVVGSDDMAGAEPGSHSPDVEGSPLAEAFAYAKELIDPDHVNWVRLDWVWF